MPRPAKKAKLLADVGASDASEDEGVKLPKFDENGGFSINEDYAKRFEHNKKREEKQRLEEKFKGSNKRGREEDDEDEDSSEDETEDDDADLATETLDREIMDTLQAIRSKDPRVYNPDIKFYHDIDEEDREGVTGKDKKKDEKPMYLQDYHRRNLLAGHAGEEVEEDDAPPVQTYQEEQDALKRELVGSMHTAGKQGGNEADGEDDDDDDDDEEFMVAKSKPKHDSLPVKSTDASDQKSTKKKITPTEIAAADKDPETYLSNFMAARAWLPNEKSQSRFTAMDSDDSDEDRRAEEFEEAYNMRFEDPRKANEKLLSFARDVGKYGVRRDEVTGRKKTREREKEAKERAKAEREEDRARLRRLRIEEVEEKVARIKEAAGLKGKDVNLEQWRDIIEGDFDDAQWDDEMARRFGDGYYAEADVVEEDNDAPEEGKKRQKVKKPRWDDDIDIKDLVPDFKDKKDKPDIALSSDEAEDDEDDDDQDGGAPLPYVAANGIEGSPDSEEEIADKKGMKTSKKARLQAKADAKRTARLERRQIEALVDSSLPLAHPSISTAAPTTLSSGGFRYRETSPTNFGLSARDILFADDTQLNSFVGLKKLHGFRDEEKKRRDKKTFSKKGRLREFRREAFGSVDEPSGGFEKVLGLGSGIVESVREEADIRGGEDGAERRKKKKRSGKGKKGKEQKMES